VHLKTPITHFRFGTSAAVAKDCISAWVIYILVFFGAIMV